MACGGGDGDGYECGEGTFEHNGQCVPYDPNDTGAPSVTVMPPGGPTRALPLFVALTTDEPATIYYTTDGSEPTTSSAHDTSPTIVTGIEDGTEIRYFAVDPSGNAAEVASAVYDLDVAGPAAVSSLEAVAEAGTISLSWDNPSDADFAGVLVVRSAGHVPASLPEDGSFYEAGETLAPGEDILLAGDGTAVTDSDAAVPGAYFYAAWSYDALGNYSPLRLSRVLRPLPAQAGSLSVDLATGTVTATAPTHLGLSATAAYDEAGNTLSLDVTVRNDTRRLLFNLKSRIEPSEGSAEGPLFGGAPYAYFGPEALDVGASITREIIITGVTGAQDPLIVDLDFADHPSLVTARGDVALIDVSGTDQGREFDTPQRVREGVVSLDGRFVHAGGKTAGRLYTFDTREEEVEELDFLPQALEDAAGRRLAEQGVTSVGGVAQSLRHGAIYVGVNDGVHWHGGGGDGDRGAPPSRVDLVWLHAGSFTELGRITLREEDDDSRTIRSIVVSPDERRAAVLLGSTWSAISELWLVDLDTFTVIDADPDTAGDQPIALSGTGWAEQGVWSEDGASFYVAFNTRRGDSEGGVSVEAIDLDTGTIVPMQPLGTGEGAGRLALRDGRLFVPTRSGGAPQLTIFDLETGEGSELVHGLGDTQGVISSPSGDRLYVVGRSAVAVYDAATGDRIDADGDPNNGITNLDTDDAGPHFLAVTPF